MSERATDELINEPIDCCLIEVLDWLVDLMTQMTGGRTDCVTERVTESA